MELKDKKALVVGAGKSGLAVSRFLLKKGAVVVLTDASNPVDQDNQLAELAAEGVELSLGRYPEVRKGSFDLVVMSPGVPLTVEPALSAMNNGITVTGELELAYHFTAAPIVAITGTNGKTTTTALLGSIFQDAGISTLVGGNIGLPLVTEVEKYCSRDVVVAEVSSFQLETTRAFKPKVGVVLNITPDHLDRHGNMDNYIAAKARIFTNQKPGDFIVLNYDDPLTAALGNKSRGDTVYFSRRVELAKGVFVSEGKIAASLDGQAEIICGVDDLKMPGAHNLENALAAVAAAKVMGVNSASLASTLKNFKGVSHRLEFVAEINGVRYVNDSKGTNPDASIKALEAYDKPIVLIAGGKNKGSDFNELAEKIKEKVRVLVVLGQSAGLIADAARTRKFENILAAAGFKEAVMMASQAARPGDIVLLSPACASWDMFNNFEERGDLFKEIVFSLKNH
ncbi:UDP-N-acetylmuramoyl-L-alanine--D-glutamate ligase [Pelotomaculum terephthalicicum JT]|uniref:UDP-N-acetylmuramoyl-L-alanine--D-glutamate ligase n=1 Tax=Pelotomaculum TaxID=191373 RepID=UPI0009CE12D6|nr:MULTISPECIES: UDP-N-acetylmuramoyl-L-alanine--D-glutamate ligase [Pelotomaculum]MCG9968081.1 UDP-N-acetylmuramoyl-L-alanine--D-glutamate ligase [Pelotomaculum terephthalicicum JT]OPX85620.1 MAG: UDP-N-acetylmuramoylalanine--D-glutamate ligase [Pelotomaculum sp. PtaB.Bin117]OPY64008.1 MAG: UDP-N-acetylmuramoylalanine--D-glutamate ligase [Pelotomaculum sp. PtaU1.Bin065]